MDYYQKIRNNQGSTKDRSSVKEATVTFRSSAIIAVVIMSLLASASTSVSAAEDFQGMWEVKDSGGHKFDITLLADGSATGTLHPGQTGSWKEQGSAAVITWKTGWTSKIEQSEGHYTHTAYRPGQPPSGPPNNTSDAQRVK
jgi:hypothetical protein